MAAIEKPGKKPACPNFGSGPTTKHPGWSLDGLNGAALGRSHRSTLGKAKLAQAIDDTREILGVPADYRIAIVPASDTGAFEMAMWSLLGPREVDVFHWESFGKGWYDDITKELKLKANNYAADFGELPDLSQANFEHDVVFPWNGTTSGVRVPNGDWIAADRQGLTLCDATSAVFAMDLPWEKLDVVTYSWQKVLGGEAAHGMIIMSPAAAKRAGEYTPSWPMPKIFRLLKAGKLNEGLFRGEVINTPSMLCVEDYLEALRWVRGLGGLPALIQRSEQNLAIVEKFVEENDWISFLPISKPIRSSTSVCLKVDLPADKVKAMQALLAKEEAANDIGSYRTAPPGLRIWCAGNVDPSDVDALMPWLKWAYLQISQN
mmetsp:Transcript_18115/g.51087  ORF Transcript_18115/g.51087 Transcript_18115/m.51087 type:complete len:376 (-) Transcript_18115:143-1270(-)|eukprot:CAMPEP_0119131182 /NCGR_PEP_ID=MMETSP1310-20130426/9672_1 /TAXON_ID=464262 /ORGANISM="Genus nov. species nov., Strain RCC2339" /LENGTH=375 /DNA_ID=CAMNT_0007121737 /DNA_START=204 /DNA_END=1331 /DNA_ORIENTATION=-